MKSGISVVADRLGAFQRTLSTLIDTQVLVGIPSAKAEREDGEPINNAAIGYINETGDPARNIPARPFLVPGVREAQKDISNALSSGTIAALSGDTAGFRNSQEAAGLIAQNAVKKKITDGEFTPLSPNTLKARKRKGRTGEKPLIDTGQLRQSITYVIRGK